MPCSRLVLLLLLLPLYPTACVPEQQELTPAEEEVEEEPVDAARPTRRDAGDVSAPPPSVEPIIEAGIADSAVFGVRADSPVPGKVVTYAYGIRNPRYQAGYHTGEDYAAPVGAQVVAVRNGTVQWSNDNGGAYGKWIGLQAENERVYVYCHLSQRAVNVGAVVRAGDLLGKVGATGNVTGPHLHFEDHPRGPFKYGEDRKPTW